MIKLISIILIIILSLSAGENKHILAKTNEIGNLTQEQKKQGVIEYSQCLKDSDLNSKNYNKNKAIKHCKLSAEFGNASAMLLLGHFNFMSKNKNLDIASKWYLQYANTRVEGYQYGYAMLGHIEMERNDTDKAFYWYTLCSKPPYRGCDEHLNKIKKYNKSFKLTP